MRMARDNRLITEFYELRVEQLMDKRVWDLPIVEKKEDVHHILNILGARNHIWVVNDKENKELVGVITELDALSILTPKKFSPAWNGKGCREYYASENNFLWPR